MLLLGAYWGHELLGAYWGHELLHALQQYNPATMEGCRGATAVAAHAYQGLQQGLRVFRVHTSNPSNRRAESSLLGAPGAPSCGDWLPSACTEVTLLLVDAGHGRPAGAHAERAGPRGGPRGV